MKPKIKWKAKILESHSGNQWEGNHKNKEKQGSDKVVLWECQLNVSSPNLRQDVEKLREGKIPLPGVRKEKSLQIPQKFEM